MNGINGNGSANGSAIEVVTPSARKPWRNDLSERSKDEGLTPNGGVVTASQLSRC